MTAKVNKISLENWIEPRYKEYSLYTCMKRALPHLVDGFKPSQRKIIYTAIRRAKNLVKVTALGGYVLAEANYKHGDSVTGTVSLMGQDFVGSNNFPLLDKKGGFGNRFGASPSAPRYIYVKISDNFDKFFSKQDNHILFKSDDLEDPDPAFYVPIIPYILINGINGIAVGFTVNIPPYNPSAIVENIENIIKNKKARVEMVPYYKGYQGEIVKGDDCWLMRGVINRKNTTTLEVTEIPVGITREAFKTHLNKLIEKDIIKDYDDISDKNWHFIIRAPRTFVAQDDEDILEELNLVHKIFEKINVIYENKVVEYQSPIDLIDDFIKIRLFFYDERKEYLLRGFKNEILKLFIKYVVHMYIKDKPNKKFDKEEAIEYIIQKRDSIIDYYEEYVSGFNVDEFMGVFDDSYKPILDNIRLNELYADRITEYQTTIQKLTQEHNTLYDKTSITLYEEDLKIIKKEFK